MMLAVLAGCATRARQEGPDGMEELRDAHRHLHERLERATAAMPLVASAVSARGQVVLAIRSGLIEELARNVARRYLDQVKVDLSAIESRASGEIRKKTFLGRVKIGEWRVGIELEDLSSSLRAGLPRVRLQGPDSIDVALPVNVPQTEGAASLSFAWDSAALVNVVCKDFDLTREIRGRVLAQRHVLSGALRLANTGDGLTITPVFPDRVIPLKLDLTPSSWGVVEAALRSQDTLGKCGLLMDPERGMARLKALAAQGVKVRLPDAAFRTVILPARIRKEVTVSQRTVALRLKAESLRVETGTVWSSVSVQVGGGTNP